MNEASEEPLLEKIAEQILARKRGGEQPTVEEYCVQYPELAEELRSFLPAMLAVEGLKQESDFFGDSRCCDPSTDVVSLAAQENASSPPSIGGYRILREIGRGGMGVVYEAEQPSLGRRVALKVLNQTVVDGQQRAKRFTSEARAAAGLHHSNIVPMFDVGADGQYLYYSMQLIRGQSLAAVIDELKRLRAEQSRKPLLDNASEPDQVEQADQANPLGSTVKAGITGTAKMPGLFDISSSHSRNQLAYYRSVADVGHQVANALAYVHARGIIHRDIKPSNLMLDGSGTVWITDFGLAKTSDLDLTSTGDIIGTLRYMAPERFKGHCDGRGDIYSLGLTLYEMLALESAFTAADHLNLVNKICRSSPISLRTYDRNVPQDLETIILKSVSKDPRFRYGSASDMADDLKRFIDDRPIKARRVSPLERFWRWSRQNRLLAVALSSSALLLFSVTIASVLFANIYRRLVSEANVSAQVANVAKQQADAGRDFATAESLRASENAQKMSDYLYVAHMQMALQAWKSGVLLRVRELLDRHLPEPGGSDQRGQDWYFLDSLCNSYEQAPALDYGGIVVFLTLDPQARYFVASGNHGALKVYDMESYQLLQTVQAHDSKILRMFSAQAGETLVTMNWDQLRIWRRHGNQFELAGEFSGYKPYSTRLTENGKALLIPNDEGTIYRWELTAEKAVKCVTTTSPLSDLVTRRDGNRFIVALRDGTVEELDAGGNRLRQLTKLPTQIRTMDTSKDGKFLVIATKDRLLTMNLDDDQPVLVDVGAAPASANGLEAMQDTFFVRCHDRVIVWSYQGEFVKELQLKPGFTPTEPMPGNQIIFMSYDNFVNIYSTETWQLVQQIAGHNSTVYDAKLTSDGRVFSGGRDGLIRIIDTTQLGERSRTLRGHTGWIWSVCFSPDGALVASASRDGSVILWDADSGNEVASLTGDGSAAHAVGFSPNGQLLAVGGWMRDVYLYNVATRERVGVLELHESKVNVTVFSPNGELLLSGGDDGRVVVWDLQTRQPLASYRIDAKDNLVWTAAFANDREVVFGGTNNALYRWEFAARKMPEILLKASEDVTSSSFSRDGKMLAVTSADGGVTLIDYASGAILMQPKGHASDAMDTAFSPDGSTLISAGSDGSVVFWSLKTREPTIRIEAHEMHVHGIDFSPDGTQFATGSWDHTVKLWRVSAQRAETRTDVFGEF